MIKFLMKYIKNPFSGFSLDMKQNKARHYVTFLLLMLAYEVGMTGIVLNDLYLQWPIFINYGLATISILALLFAIAEQRRYISNLEENIRERHVKAMLYGLVAILSVSAAWGIVEKNLEGPHLPGLWYLDLFFIGYSLSESYFYFMDKRRDKKQM